MQYSNGGSQLGDLGSGAGKGGGGGGSIREAGGAFGKREAAKEEEYFYNKVIVCYKFPQLQYQKCKILAVRINEDNIFK